MARAASDTLDDAVRRGRMTRDETFAIDEHFSAVESTVPGQRSEENVLALALEGDDTDNLAGARIETHVDEFAARRDMLHL